jgi:AcrR family transcriptional regulator
VPETSPRNPDSLFFRHLDLTGGGAGPRAAASASQRARLLEAMTRAVATKGYAKVTVADVVSLAGVSRRTFYEQFSDKEDCFLAAYTTGSQAVIDDIAAAVRASDSDDWRERVRVGITTYLEILSAEPDLARTLLVDVLGAGPRAVELRRRVRERFAALYAGEEGVVSEPYRRALVGAISELVQEHILTDGAHSLTQLAPTLVDLACTVLVAGDVAARQRQP